MKPETTKESNEENRLPIEIKEGKSENEVNMQHRLFETMPTGRLFFRCALPSMVSMMVMSLYTVADGIFVGKFIGSSALAAVNLAMPIIMISFALSDMIAIGSGVQISIKLGEKNETEASRIFTVATSIIVIISVVIMGIGLFFGEAIIGLLGADAQVTRLAADYLKVYAAFSPLIMVFFAVDNYLRICGKPRFSMVINVLMSLSNIVLDFLFIVEFGWGIKSAALASCISLAAGTFLSFIPIIRGKVVLRFTRGGISLGALGNMVANGSSEFFSNISGSILMIIVNTALLKLSGTLAVAAFSVVMYVDSIVKSLIYGMADALQPAISYNFGANNQKRLFSLEKKVLFAAGLVSVTVMGLMWAKGSVVIAMFVQEGDTALLDMSVRAMKIFVASYCICWFNIVASSFFTALNKPLASITVAFGQSLVFPIIGVFVLPMIFGLDGIWIMALVSGVLTSLVSGSIFFRLVRKVKSEDKKDRE